MKFKKQSFNQSIYNACQGIIGAVKSERNLKVQVLLLLLVLLIGWLLSFSSTEWIIIILISALVLTTEMINTAIETTIDLVCENKFNPLAKKAKDIAAGAVLIVASASLIIGSMMIIPKLIDIIK